MTEEKICPIMSRPIMMTKYCDLGNDTHSEETEAIFKEVCCLHENCLAWVSEVEQEITCKEGYAMGFGDCKEARSREDCNECHLGILTKEKPGYCKLIERGAL